MNNEELSNFQKDTISSNKKSDSSEKLKADKATNSSEKEKSSDDVKKGNKETKNKKWNYSSPILFTILLIAIMYFDYFFKGKYEHQNWEMKYCYKTDIPSMLFYGVLTIISFLSGTLLTVWRHNKIISEKDWKLISREFAFVSILVLFIAFIFCAIQYHLTLGAILKDIV